MRRLSSEQKIEVYRLVWSKSPIVTLTDQELAWASSEANRRNAYSEARRSRPSFGKHLGNELQKHTQGCLGELAYCKHRGIAWEARFANFRGSDVGNDIEVRSIRFGLTEVPAKDRDVSSKHIVCVIPFDANPHYVTIAGWYRVSDARKHDEWKANPGGYGFAHFIPIELLNQIGTLPDTYKHQPYQCRVI